MRKTIVWIAAFAVVLGVFSPASAKTKRYSISKISISVYTHADRTLNKWKVIDVSSGHDKDKVRLTGKVRGGPTKKKRGYVRVVAYNTNQGNKKRNVGRFKVAKSGKFVIWDRPPRGGRWRYKIVKARSGRYKAATKKAYVDAYHWTYLYELADVRKAPGVARLTKTANADTREYVGTTRWTEELMLNGSSQITFPTSRYRCKKISVKAGVSNDTESNVASGTIQFLAGSRVLKQLTMARGQRPVDYAGNDSASKRFRDSLTPRRNLTIKVLAPAFVSRPPADPQEPPTYTDDATDLRFLVGNPKVFCTFPSVNLSL